MPSVLEGYRVLDLTHVLAGPFASYQLAVLGAEVIKIEPPSEPDQARYQGSDAELNDIGLGTAFLSQGANKKAITLNLKTEEGRAVLRRLVSSADVLVENYRPGALDQLGLGYEDLAAIHPGLVYCSISAFGSHGPKKELTAYDGVIQAYSGMMAMTGLAGNGPVKCGAPVVDYATGTTAAMAILAALLQRQALGGQGQFVEVAMSDVAMVLCSSHMTSYLWNGAHPEQKGNRYPFATIGCYQAKDGPLMVSASNLRQQRRLWLALGRPDLVKQNNRERIQAYQVESEALTEAFLGRSVEQWETLLRKHQVPVSRVQRMEAMLADELTRHRQVLHRFGKEAQQLEGLVVPVAAFQLSKGPVAVTTHPQAPGAQNQEVLSALGYSSADIEHLHAIGAI